MAKSNKKDQSSLQLVDLSAVALSLWFVYSVISNARDLIEQSIKNAPASFALILALALVAYSWFQRNKLNMWNIVVLTTLATSAIIWLLGLSTLSGY